jgi:hypothetical protein
MHFGVLVGGYTHLKAGIAESGIGTVLLAGLVFATLWPATAYAAAIAAQCFALLGTAVGLFTIAIGIGPRTTLDLVFHVGIGIVLVSSLVATIKAARGAYGGGNRGYIEIEQQFSRRERSTFIQKSD